MSLIVIPRSWALSDKLYLCADTRLTYPTNGSHVDNIIKVMPIYGEPVPLIGEVEKNNRIAVAVAGHLEMATFLIKETQGAIESGTLSNDIRTLCEQIDSFLREKIDHWLTRLGKRNRACCLLFAGLCHSRRRKIERGQLDRLVELYKKHSASLEELAELKENFEGSLARQGALDLWKKKMPKRITKDFFKTYPREVHFRPALQELVDCGGDEMELPDAFMFGVKIDVAASVFSIERAEWGDFLCYGSQLEKGGIHESMLVELEFGPDGSGTQRMDMEETVRAFARDRRIITIGDFVTCLGISNRMFGFHLGMSRLRVPKPLSIWTDGNKVLLQRAGEQPAFTPQMPHLDEVK